jgi:hypothetical protein
LTCASSSIASASDSMTALAYSQHSTSDSYTCS